MQRAQADEANPNPQLKYWLLVDPRGTGSTVDRQKAFSYRQNLQGRTRALERKYQNGSRKGHAGSYRSQRQRRSGRRGTPGREVFDPLQSSRSEISRINRATRR